jgi:hypothetical protein
MACNKLHLTPYIDSMLAKVTCYWLINLLITKIFSLVTIVMNNDMWLDVDKLIE